MAIRILLRYRCSGRSVSWKETIQCCQSVLRYTREFPSRFISVGAVAGKEAGSSKSEFFATTGSFQDDPSSFTSSVLDNATSLSSAVFQPVDMASLGLGGFWPSGLIQSSLEVLYNYTHLPWWGCIVALTVFIRVLCLPLDVKTRVISSKLAMVSKELPDIHKRMHECREFGDQEREAEVANEMMQAYKNHGVHPLSLLPVVFARVPVFLSIYHGLKGMAAAPVESLSTGGFLWFPDLLVHDPFFCLPVIACVTFLGNVEVSVGCVYQ